MKRGIIAEKDCRTIKAKDILKGLLSSLVLDVHADEGEDNNSGEGKEPDNGNSKTPTINYEDLISKARTEEKNKQYKTIEKLKGQIDTLTKQHNDDLLKIGQLEDI